MKAPVVALNAARESRPARRINLQENPSTTAATRQTRLLRAARNLQQIRSLGVFHGRLTPPERLPLSAWIEAHIRLPQATTAVPGPMKLWPYQKQIADSIADASVE